VRAGAIRWAAAASLLFTGGLAHAADWELAGYLSFEPRVFLERPQFASQPARGLSWSAVLAPELRHEWADGANRLTIAAGRAQYESGVGSAAKLEAERRIGAAWKLELEARSFSGARRSDPLLHALRNDGFVTLRIARHF
jgi:hypothetical protein